MYESISVSTARWLTSEDPKALEEIRRKAPENIAVDGSDSLTYLAPTRVNLQLAQERHPKVEFRTTREH